jgi:hypothetical protein
MCLSEAASPNVRVILSTDHEKIPVGERWVGVAPVRCGEWTLGWTIKLKLVEVNIRN